MEALQELSDDFLTCSICLNRYTEPKQLPCLHSFCRGCLSDHIKSGDKGGVVAFMCPICRKTTYPPSSLFADPADEFPDNFYVASLISSLEKQFGTGDFIQTDKTSNGDNCPNHPNSSSVTFCTASNVGVCEECLPFHKSCDDKHIPVHAAKTKAFSDISTIKVKMTSLHNHSKRLNETLTDTPNNLRLRKEELICEISKHFSDMKNKISKLLVDKEKEMTIRLKKIFTEEEKWANEAVDENLAITEVSEKKLQFLTMQSTKRSINAISALTSMEELMKKLTDDLVRLENESDMKLIKYIPHVHLEELLAALTFGNIQSAHTEEEPALEVTDDIDKQAYPEQVPVIPSAPPAYPPNTVYTQYPGQFYPPYPMNYAPVQVPTHGAYGGMVINRNQPPKPVHKVISGDQHYLERRVADKGRSSSSVALIQAAKFNCRTPSDTRLCKIVGITPILEDVFVVVDRWNKNLKLIYLKGPVVKSVQLDHKFEPWDATRVLSTSREEVAVTCPSSKIIFFASYYNVSNQIGLNIGSHITTRVGYASLGGLSPTELVCGVCQPYGSPAIDIISMKGNLLRSFANVVTYPRSIDTSPGRVIGISDWTRKHVVLLNDKGEKLSVYDNGPQMKLKEPKGIAFYEEDFFLVVDHSDGRLHKISEDGSQEMVAQMTNNVTVVACVPVSSKFSKGGLGVVVATDEGCVHVYDGCHFNKETLI